MTKQKYKFSIYLVLSVAITFGLSLALQSILAAVWTPPTQSPPLGNTNLPIYNVSTNPADFATIGTSTAIVGNLGIGGKVAAIEYCDQYGLNCKSAEEMLFPNLNRTVIYISTASHNCQLGGRSGADNFCKLHKPDNLECGNTHALVSLESGPDDIQQMPANFGYDANTPIYWYNQSTQRYNQFSDTWAHMLDGNIDMSQQDGTGIALPVMTGSISSGQAWMGNTCFNWDFSGSNPVSGNANSVDSTWLQAANISTPAPLRCVCETQKQENTNYFLLSYVPHNGNLLKYALDNIPGFSGSDGLTAANAICLQEANTYKFIGNKDGTKKYTQDQVAAFLCNSSSCNPVKANATFIFGALNFPDIGGGSFKTNSSGQGPSDSANWGDGVHFGSLQNYWTNRGGGTDILWPNAYDVPGACGNWATSTAPGGTKVGVSDAVDKERWAKNYKFCNTTQKLICTITGNGNAGGSVDSGSSLWTQGSGDDIYKDLGKVGVGTNNPYYKLTVKATSSGPGFYLWNDNNNPEIAIGTSTGYWSMYMVKDGANGGDLRFWHGGSGVGSDMLMIDNNGNVGIGNINPQSKLEISGDMRIVSSGARPPCDAAHPENRSKIWLSQGNNSTADKFSVCAKDASNSYEWQDLFPSEPSNMWVSMNPSDHGTTPDDRCHSAGGASAYVCVDGSNKNCENLDGNRFNSYNWGSPDYSLCPDLSSYWNCPMMINGTLQCDHPMTQVHCCIP
jgi:hypothetical protein